MPCGQSMQLDCPVLPWDLPAGHLVHVEAVWSEYLPTVQAVQSEEPEVAE